MTGNFNTLILVLLGTVLASAQELPLVDVNMMVVNFLSVPSGASVWVDGEEQGISPLKMTLLQGQHSVEMRHDQYRSHRQILDVQQSGQTLMDTLVPKPGFLALEVVDAQGNPLIADVYVDGMKVGQTPFDDVVPQVGNIEVRSGYLRQAVQVHFEDGKASTVLISGMVTIPAGCFEMGSPASEKHRLPDERLHKVCLNGYRMDVTEVTRDAYLKVMGVFHNVDGCGGDCPASGVSLNEASRYCHKIGKRLPTEAEWEYAARAGTTTAWYWGNDEDQADRYAWYIKNSKGQLHPVAQKLPNAWGLYDMAGNVWEWVNDWYGAYPLKIQKNPKGPRNGSSPVFRGGAWGYGPGALRSAFRGSYTWEGFHPQGIGFRCVLEDQGGHLGSKAALDSVPRRPR